MRPHSLIGWMAVVWLAAVACAELPDKGRIEARPGEALLVGVVAPLSGPLATDGEAIVNGVRLAVERHGPLRGRPLVVLPTDDGCEAARSATQTERLVMEPRLTGVIGPACSPGCVAGQRVLHRRGLAMITPRCTDISVTRQGYGGVFRTSRTDAVEVVAAAEFARGALGVRRVFLVHDGTVYGRGLRDVFQLVWGKDRLAGSVEALTGTEDYGSVVRAIRNARAGMVYYGGFADDAARFVQQLRAAGVTLPVIAPDTLKDAEGFVNAAGAAAEGVYVTEAEPDRGPAYAAFAAAYRDRFGIEPGPSAAEAYDAATVLLRALERTARTRDDRLIIDRLALLAALPATDLNGASGRIRFRANGDRREGVTVRIYQVTNGRFVERATIRPE